MACDIELKEAPKRVQNITYEICAKYSLVMFRNFPFVVSISICLVVPYPFLNLNSYVFR